MRDRVWLAAHRGDRKHFPENTMPAMRAAVEMGADGIETDVRMTRDGHLVLIHDRDVARTTNGQGFVDEMTLAEIRALDAGGWKDAAFQGEKIPTVEEFLDYIAPTNLLINWELKEYPGDLGERAYLCADKLAELILRYGLSERSVMNSYSQKILEHIADKWPGVFAIHGYPGYEKVDVSDKPLESFSHWAVIWRKDEAHVSGFAQDYQAALDAGLKPCILVPDEPEHYERAIAMGCRMFTSDDPKRALDILRGMA